MLLMPQRLGVPGASWLPRGWFRPHSGRAGGGRGRTDFSQICIYFREGREGGPARGFFLEGLVCLQGRDASDQHIVTVMMKMMQGEGGAATPPPPSPSRRRATLQELLQVALPEGLQAWALLPALLPRGGGAYVQLRPRWIFGLRRPRRKGRLNMQL